MYAMWQRRRLHCAYIAAFLCLLALLPLVYYLSLLGSRGVAGQGGEEGGRGGEGGEEGRRGGEGGRGGEHGCLGSPEPYPAYVINEVDKCPEGKPAPFLVLLITTQAHDVEARDAIRRTWADENLAPGLGVVRLFLLGAKEGEPGRRQQRVLESESLMHHDILQQGFLDTYNNLTLKTLMGMQWVATHCPQASYVMKTDSDMFVNTNYLIQKVLRPELEPKENYFTGDIHWLEPVIRDRAQKWYMSTEEYPNQTYPPFAAGSGYMFSGGLAAKIYRASLSVRRLHLEDVYVAVCLASLGIELTPPPSDSLFHTWRVPYSSYRYSRLVTSHQVEPYELLGMWHQLVYLYMKLKI